MNIDMKSRKTVGSRKDGSFDSGQEVDRLYRRYFKTPSLPKTLHFISLSVPVVLAPLYLERGQVVEVVEAPVP